MSKNVGKIFEDQAKKSLPSYVLSIRLKDPPQSFGKSSKTRFSSKNPCDFIWFNTKDKILVPVELKSTQNKYFTFQRVGIEDQPKRMIQAHQIKGLTEFAEYENVVAGFLFNFRFVEEGIERTYFQRIQDFNKMISGLDKNSFNLIDLANNNSIKVEGEKKIKHYIWDISSLMEEICN